MFNNSREQILVADDDPMSRRLLVRTLSAAGFHCRESGDGTEALEMLHAEIPSLLLLDFEMPGLNGAEVLKRLRMDANPTIAQLPTIMLTGHGGEESEVLCLEAGADDFVTKPINSAVLRARIDTQLRLRSLRHQLQQQNDELEAWRANLERDLEAARLTQQSLIPQKLPALEGWDVAAIYRPVIQVGGDIYGWLRMADGRTLFWIADATGHGASAALLTTLAKLLFHHGSMEHTRPAAIMDAVNNDFRSIFGARSFMTAMCVALDPASGRATVVGAGHPPLLVARQRRRNGSAPFLRATARFGRALGIHGERGPSRTGRCLPLVYRWNIRRGACGRTAAHARTTWRNVAPCRARCAHALLATVIEHTDAMNGDQPLADDVAAIAVKRAE